MEPACAQNRYPGFGPRIDRRLSSRVSSVTVVKPAGAGREIIALASRTEPVITTYSVAQNGELRKERSIAVSHPDGSMHKIDHSSGNLRVMVFSQGYPSADILDLQSDRTTKIALPDLPESSRFLHSDIDNDQVPDFLFFGKEAAGVELFRGRKNGGYQPPHTLFPDISVSDIEIADLNGDSIDDFFIINWLSNSVAFYSGIGRGVFSEQISHHLPAEPADLAITSGDEGRNRRLALSIPDLREVRVYQINSLGEFRLETAASCPASPYRVAFSDINGDGTEDLVTATELSLLVFFAEDGGSLSNPSVFSGGGKIDSWDLGDVDGDRNVDAVLLGENGRRLTVLGNSRFSRNVAWPEVYSTGLAPRGIATGDFDGDGLADIATVNSGSASISVMFNEGGGFFLDQRIIPLSAGPVSVKVAAAGAPTLAISHHGTTPAISIVRGFDKDNLSVLSLPTGVDPFIPHGGVKKNAGALTLLVRTGREDRGQVSVSFFDQISADQFVETTLKPNLPGKVRAVTAFDVSMDGIEDMVFVADDDNAGKAALFVAEATERLTFSTPAKIVAIPSEPESVRGIVPGNYDRDDKPDFLMLFKETEQKTCIFYPGRDSLRWIYQLKPRDEETIIVSDLNGDGETDICCVDEVTDSVVVYYGGGSGNFGPKIGICTAEDIGGLTVASLRNGPMDLLLTRKEKGTVEILRGAF
jgi:hypothetical protein